ncbi:transcription repressor NadR [Halalkalibacillus sediminis]|uniref:Transcription repressor NadR n=1 Tax=Halalkalibacillus sediminis TaxID=2018042 RepID=A0A2I0QX51_9BACI|nr:transcription repressor NadR [Halalkalibacillus sediminis]PKR78926.1 transcription repressor NadR [Halalkalibacillus sediminis]
MSKEEKMVGEKRRDFLLKWLKDSNEPITGSQMASRASVSRQVIVGDMALLKAKDEPIISTSQGYVYFSQSQSDHMIERTIACFHLPKDTERELNLLVDHGVYVKNVIIDHPIYGEFTASLHISNRKEVERFIKDVGHSKASLLSELTDGIHLHTISAQSEDLLDEAEAALKEEGFLVNEA